MSAAIEHVDNLPVAPAESVELATGRTEAERVMRSFLATADALISSHPTDIEGQARMFLILNKLKGDIASLADACATNINDHMPDKKQVIEGVGVIEKKWANTRRFDQDAAWKAALDIADTEKVDPETGELLDPIEALVRTVRKLQTPGQWRVTVFREYGIDSDDISDVQWGKRTVTIQTTGQNK